MTSELQQTTLLEVFVVTRAFFCSKVRTRGKGRSVWRGKWRKTTRDKNEWPRTPNKLFVLELKGAHIFRSHGRLKTIFGSSNSCGGEWTKAEAVWQCHVLVSESSFLDKGKLLPGFSVEKFAASTVGPKIRCGRNFFHQK